MSKITMIRLGAIAVQQMRLRALQPGKVDEIAESMKQVGQLQEIVLRYGDDNNAYVLVAGHHRLEAARKLNWNAVRCTILKRVDAEKAELIEIDENLVRAELTAAERAMHVTRRKELYEKQHPETKQGAAPGKAGGGKKAKNLESRTFVIETAHKTRKGRSTVTRGKKVKVLPEIIRTSLDIGEELDALGKLDEQEQRELAERAKAGEKVSAKHHVEKMKPLESSVPAWKRCAIEVHSVVQKWVDEIAPDQRPLLISELRSEIDGIENGLRAGNGHHAACEPAQVVT